MLGSKKSDGKQPDCVALTSTFVGCVLILHCVNKKNTRGGNTDLADMLRLTLYCACGLVGDVIAVLVDTVQWARVCVSAGPKSGVQNGVQN